MSMAMTISFYLNMKSAFVDLLVCLFVCSSVCLFACSFVRLFVCSFVRLFVCSSVYKIATRTHTLTHTHILHFFKLKQKLDSDLQR
jgi:hypothetical protein